MGDKQRCVPDRGGPVGGWCRRELRVLLESEQKHLRRTMFFATRREFGNVVGWLTLEKSVNTQDGNRNYKWQQVAMTVSMRSKQHTQRRVGERQGQNNEAAERSLPATKSAVGSSFEHNRRRISTRVKLVPL